MTAALLALLAVACASSHHPQPVAAVTATPQSMSLTGSYLAARHARASGAEADAANFLLAALAHAPEHRVLLNRAYLVLTLDGRVGDAVPIARRLLALDEGPALAHVLVAVGDLHDGNAGVAAERLRAVPPSPLSAFLVPTLRAWAEYARGDWAAALASLQTLQSNAPLAPLYHVHAAWLNDVAGDAQAALRHAEAAIEEQPEPWLRLTELAGHLYERAGRPEDARALYARYLDHHPDSQLLAPSLARLQTKGRPEPVVTSAREGAAEALFDSAGIYGRQNNRETALALGQMGLYLRPDFAPLQILVGDMLETADRFADANQLYGSIDPSQPLAVTARIGTARNLDRMERFDEAASLLRQMAAERPDDAEPLSELGDILRKRERFAEAAAVYDEAIRRLGDLKPRHWRLLYARGIALERAKQWGRAEADFLRALDFEPDQPFVLNYLGYSWVEQGKNLERAETMIRKAVELRPNDGYIVDSLGWVLFRLGRPAEAVEPMERAVELKPEDPVINDHLGDVYWAVGRQREARFQWQAALDSNPEPELQTHLKEKLARGLVREANAEAR